ncbi:MAG: porin family protein [Sphingobacteriales bacterium]|nr:MAG: porin family protein [Sphingobacteriales bacterium]
MKKVFTLAALMASFAITKAQTGTVLVGGNVGIETNSNDQSVIEFNPFVGYQFNNNWTAGVAAKINSQKEETSLGDEKTNIIGVGPFVRYTHNISNIFSVFGQLEGYYVSAKNKLGNSTQAEANGVAVNLFPAVFINVKNGFGLNFDFGGVTYGSIKPKGGSAENSFAFNFGKNINIGISKNFGGKK